MSDGVNITVSPVIVQVEATSNVTVPPATTGSLGGIVLDGDLGGTASSPEVLEIQGTAIAPPPGGTTQFLRGDGTWQVPAGGGGGISPPAGDIGGTALAPTVVSTHLSAPLPLAQGGTAGTDAASARTALGLGTAATQNSTAFDAAGAAATAQTNAINAAASSAAGLYVPLTDLPVSIANGGTGQTSAQAAMDALAGGTTATQYLRGNGTHIVLSAIQAGDVPTLNQSTTGTASNVTGTVAVANGGTGGTTAIAGRAGLSVYNWDTPAARGLLEYNFPPQLATISNNFVSQSIYGTTIISQSGGSTSKVGVGVLSSASTPTSGQNVIAIYSISGTTATQMTITGDLGTWGSQGFNSYAFGAGQTLTAGATYILLLMSNATTPVHLAGLSTTAGFPPMYNAGLSNTAAPWFKVFLYGTAQTALPGSFTISGTTMASTNAQFPWVCLL